METTFTPFDWSLKPIAPCLSWMHETLPPCSASAPAPTSAAFYCEEKGQLADRTGFWVDKETTNVPSFCDDCAKEVPSGGHFFTEGGGALCDACRYKHREIHKSATRGDLVRCPVCRPQVSHRDNGFLPVSRKILNRAERQNLIASNHFYL